MRRGGPCVWRLSLCFIAACGTAPPAAQAPFVRLFDGDDRMGDSFYGQTAEGLTFQCSASTGCLLSDIPALIGTPSITSGGTFSDLVFAVASDGTVVQGCKSQSSCGTWTVVPGVDAIASVDGTCGVDGVGAVHCWGSKVVTTLPGPVHRLIGDTLALLTDGDLYDSNTGQAIGVHNVIGATNAVDASFSCAIAADSTLSCWGANDVGQLGDGTLIDRSSPVVVGTGFTDVEAGMGDACGLRSDGTVACWGLILTTATPVQTTIPNLTGVRQIAQVTPKQLTALLSDGSVVVVEFPVSAPVIRTIHPTQ